MLQVIGLLIAVYTASRCVSALGWNVTKGESVIGKITWALCLTATIGLSLMLLTTHTTTP
jgi:hypothetical protein